MQATQITATETISAAIPIKASATTHSSKVLESFGLKLHRHVLATETSSTEQSSTQATKISNESEPKTEGTMQKTDAKSSQEVPNETANLTVQTAHGVIVPSGAAPDRVARQEIPPTVRQVGDGQAIARGFATQALPSSSKQIVKPIGPTNLPEVVQPQDVALAVAVATLGVQVISVPGTPIQVDAPQSLTPERASMTKGASPRIKLNQASTTAETTKDVPARPDSTAVKQLPSSSASATAVQSKFLHEVREVLESPGRNDSGVAPNTEVSSSVANSPHLSQPSALSAVAALVQQHPGSSSAQADPQVHATNVLDAAGIRSVHVMPSGPTQLEVGVLDGTHGWLRIRAELGAGGAVSASLTATAVAHESLRAALPQMAEYLGGEAVSVTKLVVHRFGEDAGAMGVATQANQGGAEGRHAGGQETQDGDGAQKHLSAANNQEQTSPAFPIRRRLTNFDEAPVPATSPRNREISRASTRSHWSFAGFEGVNGSWLSVSA